MVLLASFHDDIVGHIEAGHGPDVINRYSKAELRHTYRPGAVIVSRGEGKPAAIGLSWGGLLRFADGSATPFPVTNPANG